MSSIVFAHKAPLTLTGIVEVPSSKSVANRSLVLDFLCGFNRFDKPEESWSNDIRDMWLALQSIKKGASKIDIGESGTALRFLSSVLSIQEGKNFELVGHGRISERPLKPLLEALEQMGASFKYIQKPYYAPLHIEGKKLIGKSLQIASTESSQYASALLLVAPFIENGIHLHFGKELKSASYLKLTIAVLRSYGANLTEHPNSIEVRPSKLIPTKDKWPCDWSSIPYFLALAACASEAEIVIKDVEADPLQADFAAVDLFKKYFNIECKFEKEGLRISKKTDEQNFDEIILNGSNFPDLVPTLFACAAFHNRKIKIEGIGHLKHKESDRIAVLSTQLRKIGFEIRQNDEDSWLGAPVATDSFNEPHFDAQHDHRMAMSFSLFSLKFNNVRISGAESVNKSFPDYWKTLSNLGFHFEIT